MAFPYFLPFTKNIEFGLSTSLVIICFLTVILVYPYAYFKKGKWFTKYLFNIGFYFSYSLANILYLPMLNLVLTIANSQTMLNNVNFNITNFIVSIVGIVFLFVIGFVYKIFIFNPMLNLSDPSSLLNSTPRAVFHIIRTLISIIASITFANANIHYSLKLFVIFALMIYYYHSYKNGITIYHNKTRICNLVFACFSIWFIILSGVRWIYGENLTEDLLNFVFVFGGIGLCITCVYIENETYTDLIHFSDINHINVVKACYSMLIMQQNYLTEPSHSNQFILTAYLWKHFEKCKFSFCPLTRLAESTKNNPLKNSTQIMQALLYSVNRIFKKLVIYNQDAVYIKIMYIAFLMKYMPESSILAWEIYHISKRQNLTPLESYMLQYFRNELKSDSYHNLTEQTINPLIMLRKIATERKFNKMLVENSVQYSQFWDLLQDASPIYEKFYNCGCRIIKSNKIIKSLWKQLNMYKFKIARSTQLLYYKYKIDVQFDRISIDEIISFENSHFNGSSLNLAELQMDSGIVSVSARADSIGKILKANSCLCQLSGYTKEELLNSTISQIIPKIYRETHIKAFEADCYSYECGEYKNHEYTEKFLQHKSGYIVPISMQVVNSPNVLNSYCFIGKIKRASKNISSHNIVHVLCNPNGIITEISSSILFNMYLILINRCNFLYWLKTANDKRA